MSRLRYLILLLGAPVIMMMGACSSSPDGVIPPGKMARLLADLHEGEGVAEVERATYGSDSMKLNLRESIYAKHGITAEKYDSSMMWYGKHIEKYMDVYDDAIEILENRLKDANKLAAKGGESALAQTKTVSTFEGDSVDVWTAQRHARFYNRGGNNYIISRMGRDLNWEENDVYTLRYKAINPTSEVNTAIIAEYDDGTYTLASRSTGQDGWQTIRLVLDATKHAQAIGVSIGYEPKGDEVMYIDSISLIRQRPRRR